METGTHTQTVEGINAMAQEISRLRAKLNSRRLPNGKHATAAGANARIAELEDLMGLPRSVPSMNLIAFNARLRALEDLARASGIEVDDPIPSAVAPPSNIIPVPPTTAAVPDMWVPASGNYFNSVLNRADESLAQVAQVAAVQITSTASLFAAALEIWNDVDRRMVAELSESELRAKLATRFWQARLSYPGASADVAKLDTAKLRQNISDERFCGQNRAAVAITQSRVDKILRTKSPALEKHRQMIQSEQPAQVAKPATLTGRSKFVGSLKIRTD